MHTRNAHRRILSTYNESTRFTRIVTRAVGALTACSGGRLLNPGAFTAIQPASNKCPVTWVPD